MHIGLVVYGSLDHTSGGFRYDRRLVDYLRACGDTVDVISLPWRDYWRAALDGARPAIAARLNRPVDVLVQDELCHPSLWGHHRQLTRPGGVVALVHHVQSDERRGRLPWLRRWIERKYLDGVDGAIYTSEFTRQRAAGLARPPETNLVAPPAGRIEGRGCTNTEIRQRAAEKPLRITFVGALVARKDPKTLLAALAALSTRRPDLDWELTIIGSHKSDPDYAASLHEQAADLGVDDRVTFAGEVSDARLRSTLENSHVLCVPSRYEGFGMVYLEAMEHGVVPIASAHGGAGEFITEGENGALVAPGDSERIADLLADWGTDRDRLAALGVAALDTAAAHPTWDDTLAEVRSLLCHVAESSSQVADTPPETPPHTDPEQP